MVKYSATAVMPVDGFPPCFSESFFPLAAEAANDCKQQAHSWPPLFQQLRKEHSIDYCKRRFLTVLTS